MAGSAARNRDDALVWQELIEGSEPALGIDQRPKSLWESLLYGRQHTRVDNTPLVFPFVVAAAVADTAEAPW